MFLSWVVCNTTAGTITRLRNNVHRIIDRTPQLTLPRDDLGTKLVLDKVIRHEKNGCGTWASTKFSVYFHIEVMFRLVLKVVGQSLHSIRDK
jgi:hypothetical protein